MYDDKLKNDAIYTYELAGMGARFFAYFIDAIVLNIFTSIIVGIGTRFEGSFAISTMVAFVYYWYFWTQRDGQTPGKSVLKIQVIKTDGAPMTSGDVVLRFIGYWISGLFMGIGFLWAAFDANSQGWHDKIAGTYVVKVDDEKRKKRYVTV